MSDHNVAIINLEVLKDIRGELREMKSELTGVKSELTGLRGELKDVKGELRTLNHRVESGFAMVDARFETLENETIQGFTGVRRAIDQIHARLDGLRDLAASGR